MGLIDKSMINSVPEGIDGTYLFGIEEIHASVWDGDNIPRIKLRIVPLQRLTQVRADAYRILKDDVHWEANGMSLDMLIKLSGTDDRAHSAFTKKVTALLAQLNLIDATKDLDSWDDIMSVVNNVTETVFNNCPEDEWPYTLVAKGAQNVKFFNAQFIPVGFKILTEEKQSVRKRRSK